MSVLTDLFILRLTNLAISYGLVYTRNDSARNYQRLFTNKTELF